MSIIQHHKVVWANCTGRVNKNARRLKKILLPKYQSNDIENCFILSSIHQIRLSNLPGFNQSFLLVEIGDFSSLGNHLMEKLESVQYAAALAVTGTWGGTSRERLYNELGWEPLCLRRWSRRLILFYKFVNELTPDYTRDPIPPLKNYLSY